MDVNSILDLINVKNIYILISLTLIVGIFTTINMLASGKFYRAKISKSDTNLNIIEKLLETKNITITDKQKEMCSKIIDDSLINLMTGYKLTNKNINIYNQVLSLTSRPYLSYFSAKIKSPKKSLYESSIRMLRLYSLTTIVIILALLVASVLTGNILSQTSSINHISFDLNYKIAFFFDLFVYSMLFIAYITSFNRLSNAIILFVLCRNNKELGSIA